jgi:hypothetical protein
MSNKTIETHTLEFKRKLKERIEKITKRDCIEKIKLIIFKNNPNLSYTQNSSGVLLFFHNLSDITYDKLDSYLKKIDNESIKYITMTLSEEELLGNNMSESLITNNIRLSSLEKNIIKKKDYYEKLKEENNVDTDIIYKSDDDNMDIFLNKDSPIETQIKQKIPIKSIKNNSKNSKQSKSVKK